MTQWGRAHPFLPCQKPCPNCPTIWGVLAGVGGDMAVCGVGCICGWCWPWWTSCVHQHNVSQVGMSGTGQHHNDVAGNDLEEIQKVC